MIDFIASPKTKNEKSHLRNLVVMAKADNHLDRKEIDCIYKIGKRRGLKEKHIEEVLLASKNEQYEVPVSLEEKFEQLHDLVEVMLSDGQFDDKEMKFCSDIATEMGMRRAVSGVLITKITRCITEGIPKERTFAQSKPFLI